MTDTLTATALAYYAAHGAALFPIPAGKKSPFGINFSTDPTRAASFKHDFSRDPAVWASWQASHPDCNFGVVAFASQWIIADIDTSVKVANPTAEAVSAARAEAWSMWCELCAEWGVAPQQPHVQSARGGWHTYFQVPPDIDASALRQPDAVRDRINIRCVGFTVAAGSYYDGTAKNEQSGPYLLLTDAPPHPAPAALLTHCTRVQKSRTDVSPPGSRDKGDVAGLLTWLNERGAFSDYESWFQCGMALRIEFGDAGLDLWELTFDGTVSDDLAAAKWDSFASEPDGSSVTLSTFLDRAHKLGWRGTVRKSTSSMFDGVAAIAAAAGASLSSGMPLPPGPGGADRGMPMLAGQEVLTTLATPILQEFLAATSDAPARPISDDFPTLPASMSEHGLFAAMQECIARVVAMAEPPQKFKKNRVTSAMIVLSVLHQDIYEAVRRRVETMGHNLDDRKIKLGANALSDQVQRAFVKQDDWIYDARSGLPEADNPDNMVVFLEIIGCEVRYNAWLERMEIKGGTDVDLRWSDWTYVDDTVVAKLRMRALRDKTRFKIGKDFTWEALTTLGHKNTIDPARERLRQLEKEWDGVPRLAIWLTAACGATCDPYHQAVSKNIIGGMVRRIRQPGCKHDFMPVFFGPQGTGKSTMAAIIADMGQSTLPEILKRSTEWFSDEVMLGDASKELVLSLAGKCLIEIAEMGMRGSANPNHVKAMLSRQVDRGRTAYARSITDRPRRNVFFGTVNDDEPLVDPTGNRRFLPVNVPHECDLKWLSAHTSQLVGEAAALETAGHDFAIPRDVWGDAALHQENARSATDMEIMLGEWFTETTHSGPVSFITAADLVHLSNLSNWRNGGATVTRGAIMKRMGFRSEKPIVQGKRTVVWVRGECKTSDIPKVGVRYMVGAAGDGRPMVTIRRGEIG